MITDERIKELLVNNSREWIKELSGDISVLRVDDFIEDLRIELNNRNQHAVTKSVCNHCRFKEECRFKSENTFENCKFFIDKDAVL